MVMVGTACSRSSVLLLLYGLTLLLVLSLVLRLLVLLLRREETRTTPSDRVDRRRDGQHLRGW